jgi:hypothetical protein
VIHADNKEVSSYAAEYDSGDEIDLTDILSELKPSTPLKASSAKKTAISAAYMDDDDDIADLGIAASPPRMTKVLLPSKCAIQDGQRGWIPSIAADEYAQAPGFLRLQVRTVEIYCTRL